MTVSSSNRLFRAVPRPLEATAQFGPLVAVVLLGIFGLGPFGIGSDYWSAVIVMVGIYMMLTMGLNVVVGYAGLLDLGYAGFWAVGAYATAIVTGKAPFHPVHLSIWAAIPVAVAATVISGIALGLVTLRVRGDYLAIVTLGFGEIVRIVANSWDHITGGPSGVTDIPHPALFGLNFGLEPRYYVALIWVFVGALYYLLSNLWRSRIGRAWYAVRQDEDAAEILGVPTFRMKLLAFAVGASTAGFAGVVYSSYVGYIVPSNFQLLTAIMILAAVVMGGMSNMKGVMLGAAAIILLPELFRELEQARFLIFAMVLILTTILRPGGLVPFRARRYPAPPPDAGSVAEQIAGPPLANLGRAGSMSRAEEAHSAVVLRCRGLAKSFGGLAAIRSVNFSVREGTIFAVIGPNGAGKSTLFNLICGIMPPDSGGIDVLDGSVLGLKPHAIAQRGVGRTFQNIRLLLSVTVVENVLLGADLRHRCDTFAIAAGLPNARRADARALADAYRALSVCGIAHLADRLAGSLSYGDQRRVEIARALSSWPRLLLLDEPAAGMNPTERRELGELIQRIRSMGITIVLVEHDMRLIMGISDEVMVLHHGTVIATGQPELVQRDPEVIEAYLGTGADRATATGRPAAGEGSVGAPAKMSGSISVEKLKVAYGPIEAVHGIDLEVRDGEIVSIVGANGAGKTSTLLAVSGVHRAASGAINFGGRDIARWPAHKIAAAGIAHVPEGRRIFPRMTVWENLAMGTYSAGTLPRDADLEFVLALFPVLKERMTQLGGTLSGGEQQMLAMARALVSRPKLLLLDEPSMGLAPQLVNLVFAVIREINGAGIGVLLVEQNARMALQTAHRAYVLESGYVRLSGPSADLLNDDQVRAAYLGG